jgi:hypothetical protein
MQTRLTLSASLWCIVTLTGCDSDTSTPSANGGAAGGNSTAGAGGTPSTGGATSAGASSQAGGAAGSSGSGTSGGSAGTAGGAPNGGSAGGSTGGASGGGPSGPLPPVYDEEDTGADCPKPPLPDYAALPAVTHLPDPFKMADGTTIASRSDWRCRRAEIKARLEKYDVGEKPDKPSTFTATLNGDTISIVVGEGATSFTMTAEISRPAGAPSGPIPAIIGVNAPTGSLPANVFSSRGIATITFHSDQLAPSFDGSRSDGNFYKLYPSSTAGFMIRWAWGVSRLIDALEALPDANIDSKRLAISGCSFQGKIALYAGAFDERIALTIPHESGGGGTISWRYSDMLEKRDDTEVENLLHAQGAPWYATALMQFNDTPDKLPFDHHELMGMVAPRALLAIESTAIARMGAEAARVDALAARRIWTALGEPFRVGASEENIGHCSWHDGFTPALEAYVDKFLLDKDADTDILRSKFSIDEATWLPWETPMLK